MFVPCDLQPNEVGYLKVLRIEKPKDKQEFGPKLDSTNSLSVEGISPESEVLFMYKNTA